VRILLLSDLYRPVIGGLERHVEALAAILVRRGHRVTVATLTHPEAADQEEHEGVRIYRLGGWYRALAPFYAHRERPFHPTLPDPGLMRALARVVERERPQLVHAHGWVLYSAVALLRHRRIPLIATLHDYGSVCARRTLLQGEARCTNSTSGDCIRCAAAQYGTWKAAALVTGLRISHHMLPHADAYVAVSTAVASACRRATGGAPLLVLPTFVPDELFEPQQHPRPAFVPTHGEYLLYVGALAAHKGVDVLLGAYRDLPAAPPLVLLGTAYDAAARHYPPGVTVAYRVAHHEVMDAWAGASFGLVPSIWPDPLPQVLLEAMLSGKAVIASATGGILDVVQHERTGLLVPPGDRLALRDAVQRLLHDPQLRAHLGTAGRQAAERYRVSTVVGALESLYNTLLAAAGTTGGQR
jgi:glycosyltransferase involved in cell wall biosynthesis